MTASVLQVVWADQGSFGPTGTTQAATITGVTAGSTIYVVPTGDDAASITVADNVNGSYGAVLDTVDDTTNAQRVSHFRFENSASGTLIVTATYSTAISARALVVIEVGGVKTSSALDGHNGALSSSVAATNANQPALVVAVAMNTVGSATPAAGGGFTDNGSGWGFGSTPLGRAESKRVTTATSQTASFTNAQVSVVAIFDEAAATPGSAAITEGSDAVAGTGSTTVIPQLASMRMPGPGVGPFFLNQFVTRPPAYTAAVIAGNAAMIEGADVVAGSGSTTTTGAAGITEGSDAVAGSGTTTTTGTAAIVEGADSVTASGATGTAGTAAITEGADAVAGTGGLTTTGAAAITEDPDTAAGAGTLTTTGTAAITEGLDAASGTGFTGSTGVAAITEDADVVAGSGSQSITGAAAVFEGSDIVVAFGTGGSSSGAGRHHKRYGVRDGNKLLVFDTRQEADAAKAAISTRAKPGKKPAKIKATPSQVIDLRVLQEAATQANETQRYHELVTRKSYPELISLHHELSQAEVRRIQSAEEEELAMILLHLL